MEQTIIYQAVNLVNGKRYIGLTEKGLRLRKLKHFANARRGQSGKFYTAIRKHGADQFHFAELVSCRDYWHGLEVERLYISLLKPEYNLTEGGGGVKGLKFSAESRAKMSAAKKGRKGHPCPEWLKKINSNLRLTTPLSEKFHTRRPIKCLADGLEFESGAAAAAYYGLHRTTICRQLKGKRQKARFVYIEVLQ